MKILLLSYKFYPEIGGIEVNSAILARHFVALGAEVHVLTTTKRSGSEAFPFEVIRNPSLNLLFREHQWADVVFENNPCLSISWPLFFYKKTHVIALRTWISRVDGKITLKDKVKLRWIKRANSVISVSESIRRETYSNSIVIGNPYRADLFNNFEVLEKDRDFVFLGRLVSDKGCDMAIALLHSLHKNSCYQNLNLTIIGDGPDLTALQDLVDSYGLNHFVRFLGVLQGDTLSQCLATHKYILIPSRWREPFGNVALEGMACGCLPIVSDGGGLVDAVGNAGLVFKRNNLEDMESVVTSILDNQDREQTLRGRFRKHLDNHLPHVVAERYLNVIENAIQVDR